MLRCHNVLPQSCSISCRGTRRLELNFDAFDSNAALKPISLESRYGVKEIEIEKHASAQFGNREYYSNFQSPSKRQIMLHRRIEVPTILH